MKNNTLWTADIIFINKLPFPIFFFFLIYEDKCMDSMVPCYSLLNMKVIWLCMVSSPSHYNGGTGGDLIWKFAKLLCWQNVFLELWQDKLLWVELKTNGGVIFITTLLHFTSLETASTQKSEVFLLRISLGNVNASVVTCRYPQIYNFGFRK